MADGKIETLLKSAKEGHKEAENELFGILLARFRLFVNQRIWNKEDCEEVVQEALTAIIKEYRGMDFSASFSSWAYKVLDYRILSYIQSQRRRASKVERLENENVSPSACTVAVDPELKRRLIHCLKKIGKKNIIYMRTLNFHYQGYSTDEICRTLSLTRANLYSVLSRARSLLQACLEKGKDQNG
jgi:RNA polymerase sigma factor (sigma-70 family)